MGRPRSTPTLSVHGAALEWRAAAVVVLGREADQSRPVAELLDRGASSRCLPLVSIDGDGLVHPAGSPPLPLVLLVSTIHGPDADGQPRVLRGARAVLAIIEHLVAGPDDLPGTLSIAARLAAEVTIAVGSWGDAEQATLRIIELADRVLDHEQEPGDEFASAAATFVHAGWAAALDTIELGDRPRGSRASAGAIRAAGLLQLTDFLSAEHYRGLSGLDVDGRGPIPPPLETAVRDVLPRVGRELGSSVTCVYFAHEWPPRFDGGELVLFDDLIGADGSRRRAPSRTVVPAVGNSLVCFRSDAFYEVASARSQSTAPEDRPLVVTLQLVNDTVRANRSPSWPGTPTAGGAA